MYVIQYMREGSGIPVDCSVGLRSVADAKKHGRSVCTKQRYCGFWIGYKPNERGVDPERMEFHPVYWDTPHFGPTFGKVLQVPAKTWEYVWSPEGRPICQVTARTTHHARAEFLRQYPMYKKYLGEVYRREVITNG